MSAQDREKSAAAAYALGLVRPGMVIGLGTGSTAEIFLHMLSARVRSGLNVLGVPTSARTRRFAEDLGIALCSDGEVPDIDLTVDGTDEADPGLRLIKGAGGALLGEKIVAAASRAMVVIADSSKRVEELGAAALPVEVVPFGWRATAERIGREGVRFGAHPPTVVRRGFDGPYRTDAGHFILDCAFGRIVDPEGLAAFLDAQPGVVEHGLFLGFASAVVIGAGEGVEVLGALPSTGTPAGRMGEPNGRI